MTAASSLPRVTFAPARVAKVDRVAPRVSAQHSTVRKILLRLVRRSFPCFFQLPPGDGVNSLGQLAPVLPPPTARRRGAHSSEGGRDDNRNDARGFQLSSISRRHRTPAWISGSECRRRAAGNSIATGSARFRVFSRARFRARAPAGPTGQPSLGQESVLLSRARGVLQFPRRAGGGVAVEAA